jgi:hypothetical protein
LLNFAFLGGIGVELGVLYVWHRHIQAYHLSRPVLFPTGDFWHRVWLSAWTVILLSGNAGNGSHVSPGPTIGSVDLLNILPRLNANLSPADLQSLSPIDLGLEARAVSPGLDHVAVNILPHASLLYNYN